MVLKDGTTLLWLLLTDGALDSYAQETHLQPFLRYKRSNEVKILVLRKKQRKKEENRWVGKNFK